jgi:hypothetical protein
MQAEAISMHARHTCNLAAFGERNPTNIVAVQINTCIPTAKPSQTRATNILSRPIAEKMRTALRHLHLEDFQLTSGTCVPVSPCRMQVFQLVSAFITKVSTSLVGALFSQPRRASW